MEITIHPGWMAFIIVVLILIIAWLIASLWAEKDRNMNKDLYLQQLRSGLIKIISEMEKYKNYGSNTKLASTPDKEICANKTNTD